MSANATNQKSSKRTQARMKDGEEPTEVLLALVSSPLLALLARGLASIVTAKNSAGQDVLAVIFANSHWSETVGIVLGNDLPTVANTEATP